MSIYLGNNLIAPNQSNAANKSLSNLSSDGEKHFLNKTQISNCILEAPNGVITYSGNTVTLKAGVKVLIPNGRNSDGTLNNIEITTQSDTTYTIQSYQANRNHQPIFIDNMGNLQYSDISSNNYFITDSSTSGTYDANYSPKTNLMKRTHGTAGSWETVQYCYIGWMSIDSNLNITSVHIEQPIRLFTSADSSYMSGMGMPSDKYINLTFGASGSQYTAPASGWFCLTMSADAVAQFISMQNVSTGFSAENGNSASGRWIRVTLPVLKNDVVQIAYTAKEVKLFRFYYAQGSESEAN